MLKLVEYEPWDILSEIPQIMRRSYAYKSDRSGENNPRKIDASKIDAPVAPSVSISEEDDKFLLVMDMPGVAPDQVSVTFDKGICTVKGSRPDTRRPNTGKLSTDAYTYDERVHGDFERSFRCEAADPERITAKIQHGLLQITIMKYVEAQPRNIAVEG